MSAIIGIYARDGRQVNRLDLARMVGSMAHRGPDGTGMWCEGAVGLGHQMRWTTPESLQEKLPLVNLSGDLALTTDARIDNRDELISKLGLGDRSTAEIKDSDLILSAYQKWGERCPEHLLGDFAFAIWDRRKQQLFCARDHFGVKPFYYHLSDCLFAFATEIKALLFLPAVPRRVDEVRVAEFLTVATYDKTLTFYQDILRLPPGHALMVSREATQICSYWSLDPSREVRLGSDEEYAEAFCDLFTRAVRCRLRSAFPVGTMLSGGLDSSSITCVARRLMPQNGERPLLTLSAVFDEVTQCDERPYIQAVLAQGGLEPHYFHADRVSPLTELDRVLWHLDEPQGLGNLYVNWSLHRSAHERGVRVVLDGFDGDTTVSHGDGYWAELAYAGRWLTLAREVRAFSRIRDLPWGGALWSWYWLYGLDPMISRSKLFGPLRRIRRTLARRAPGPRRPSHERRIWGAPLRPEFAHRIGLAERLQGPPGRPKTERDRHYRRLTDAGQTNTLENMDRVAGAFSLEVRFPFWDRLLAEFCLAIPPEQKRSQGWTRLVMRRAMAGILPQEVQWRPLKSDLGPGFDHGLLTFERERVENVILKEPELLEAYVDTPALHEACARFLSGQATVGEMLAVWKALSLALWLKHVSSSSDPP